MRTDELDYKLPEELIAVEPAEPRDSARLMVVHRETGAIEHRRVRDLLEVGLGARDLLVFNESRVIPARFSGVREATGGAVHGLFLEERGERGADRGVATGMADAGGAAGDSTHAGGAADVVKGASEEVYWHVLLESGGKLVAGDVIRLEDVAAEGGASRLELVEKPAGGEGKWVARLVSTRGTRAILEAIGSPPLPPYIMQARKRLGLAQVGRGDKERYNTVYAGTAGSVAAPTAGLHFTHELLGRLGAAGVARATVTLHVGMGTFAPVRAERLEDHAMQSEWFSVPAATLKALAMRRACGSRGRIIPVGTTTVRALESLPTPATPEVPPEVGPKSPLAPGVAPEVAPLREVALSSAPEIGLRGVEAYTGRTSLFIRPGGDGNVEPYRFRYADGLMTNFHLPRSTLLALVAAGPPGVGLERLKEWYEVAIRERYRFYSYGDAMLIL